MCDISKKNMLKLNIRYITIIFLKKSNGVKESIGFNFLKFIGRFIFTIHFLIMLMKIHLNTVGNFWHIYQLYSVFKNNIYVSLSIFCLLLHKKVKIIEYPK